MDGLIVITLFFIMIISAINGFVFSLCEDGMKSVINLVICIVSCFLLFYPMFKADGINYERSEKPYVTHEIMALADNNMMSGRIYMRSGYIDEAHHYLYGYKNHQGGMKTQKVKADNAVVFFTDDVNPCAKWYKETKNFWYMNYEKYTCDIYLPTDALVADYKIDLQ